MAENRCRDRHTLHGLPEEGSPRFVQRCSVGLALLLIGGIAHVMVGHVRQPTLRPATDVLAAALALGDPITAAEDPTELLAVLRTGYAALYMQGIVGRAAFHEGVLYLENRNQFDWHDVQIILDDGATHDAGRVMSSAVYRLRPDRKPATVHVAASVAAGGLGGVMSFGPPASHQMLSPRHLAVDVGD
jgi:hypothetical protein